MAEPPMERAHHLENTIIVCTSGHTYRLINMIALGIRKVIYRCVDETEPHHPVYACKVIAKGGLTEEGIAFLRREVMILRRIDHQNVLGVHDCVESDEFIFLITPLMDGGSLLEILEGRGRFTEPEARRILTQVISGLAYLHRDGICHRDIKPENILCSGEEDNLHVAISGFGLSTFNREGERMTTRCGTLQFMAPEVIRPEEPYTEACDMWSLGVLAYAVLTGFYPFEVMEDPMVGEYNRTHLDDLHISAEARGFIERLLQVNPNERPTASYLLNQDPWLNAP